MYAYKIKIYIFDLKKLTYVNYNDMIDYVCANFLFVQVDVMCENGLL